MKLKTQIILIVVCLAIFNVANAQRPFFNKSKDLLIAQFDSKPDPDDIHAQAALGSMLAHSDFNGVKYYGVAGAYGRQGGQFIDSDELFDMVFGSANWTDADADRNGSVTRIANRVVPILNNGGKVWVQEAGQSNITRDWIVEVKKRVNNDVVKNNVIVVQHSEWNQNHADNTTNKPAANPVIINFIKNNSRYFYIDDGNAPFGGFGDHGPWETPEYRSRDKKWLNQARNSPNAKAKQLWNEATRVVLKRYPGGVPYDWSFMKNGGIDYSDCVENWWIFNIGSNADSVTKFWNRYVINTTGSNPDPDPDPSNCDKTYEEKNGIVAVEAENFVKQSKTKDREWFVIGAGTTGTPTPDPDPIHSNGASGGKYIELLPDTRVTHGDPLVTGVSFSDTPGVAAIVDYKIKFNSPGKYFVWVRAHSTGSEDNGVHVGIDGNWPASGARMQWCTGKNAWTWESKQRTAANHCGVAQQIFINVPTAGIHTISFSMREDGFEMDKFILSKAYTKPTGTGAAPIAANCDNPNPNPTSIAVPGTIQVENFVAKNGDVKAENTPGGGRNLGFIKNNNYTEYNINVANAGSYKLEAFTSSNGVGGNIVASVAGNNLATIAVPVNNDWHNYSTPVSGNVNLAAGVQKIRFTYTGAAGFLFNFDRAVFTLNTPANSANCNAAPANLAVSGSNATSVTISYANTANDTRTFELRAFPKGGFTGNINTGGVGFASGAAGSTSITMNGLQSGTSYDFVLRALCSGGTPGASPLAPTIVGSTTGGGSTPTTSTTTLTPVNDSYLQGSTNFNSNIIRIENGNRVGYLMFDLSGISGTITDAKLKFTVAGDAGNGNLNVNLGNSNNWNETNLSNGNKPANGVLLGSINKTYTIGNTETVALQANSISGNAVSLVLNATGGNDFAIASKENTAATVPQLIVTYQSSKTGDDNIIANENAIIMYPNPTTDVLRLNGVSEMAKITVSDIAGKQVLFEMKSSENERVLDVSGLQSGVYFVTVQQQNQNKRVLRFSKR